MKILHITDLHGHKLFYEWLLAYSQNYDVICISGDLIGATDQFSQQDKKNQQEFVLQCLEQMPVPTFVCSGNHDITTNNDDLKNLNLDDFNSSIDDGADWSDDYDLSEIERCIWLNEIDNNNIFTDNSIKTIQGITFAVVPYNNNNGLSRFSSCDVLIHHEPPAHTATAIQQGEDFGNDELYYALKNKTISPDYVLCGHVHSPDKNRVSIHKTIICNPGASFNDTVPNKNELQIS